MLVPPSRPTRSATFPKLRPAADYRVRLDGVSPNCDVAEPSIPTVAITAGATASVTFAVECVSPLRLAMVRDGDIYTITSNGTGDRDHSTGELYVMNADGSTVVRLTNNAVEESAPAWSPDGTRIAFVRTKSCFYYCTSELFVMNADGTNERMLPSNGTTDVFNGDPSWAPNGLSIAFTRQYCPYYCDPPSVGLVDLGGSVLGPIANNASNPAWRP